jgi:putative membrane protein
LFKSLLVRWILMALSLMIVAYVVPGIRVTSIGAALVAAVVIGLVNSTVGVFLKIVTFPLTILTLGIFWLVINGLMLALAAFLVDGFAVDGLFPAIIGSIALSFVNLVLRGLFGDGKKDKD